MKNKKKIVTYTLIIAIISLAVLRYMLISQNPAIYRIYSEDSNGQWYYKVLGVLPDSYKNRFSRTVLEANDEFKLVNLEDKYSSVYSNYIIIENNKGEEIFLKAYPFSLVHNDDIKRIEEVGWEGHASLLINLETFNYYTNEKNIDSKEDVIKTFLYMLSNPEDTSSYRILKDSIDTHELTQARPLITFDFLKASGHKIIQPDNIKYEIDDNEVVCWLYNKGVIKFRFKFKKGNNIESVESAYLGFLGNEVPSM